MNDHQNIRRALANEGMELPADQSVPSKLVENMTVSATDEAKEQRERAARIRRRIAPLYPEIYPPRNEEAH